MASPQPSNERQVLIPTDLTLDHLRGANSGLEVVLLEGETMGSYWRLHYQRPPHISSTHIRRRAELSFDLVIRQMSHWDAESELRRFNAAPAGERFQLSPEFRTVLRQALEIAKLTDGVYDPTVGRLVAGAGFGPHAGAPEQMPDTRGSWRDLSLRADGSASHAGHCQLDLSSIAKGYAIDHAAAGLKQLGIHDFLLEIGGEFRGEGCKPDGQPWWVALDPMGKQAAEAQTVAALCGISLATSGIAEQRIRMEDGESHHLIDPATGRSAVGALQAVSVLAPTCMLADAWATALFVLGESRGAECAEQHGIAASFVTRAGAGFHEKITPAYTRMLTDSSEDGDSVDA